MRWLARSEHTLPADMDWLSGYETERVTGYRFPKRRAEYMLRRYTAKRAVAAELGLAVDAAALSRIEIRNAPSGAPYVVVGGTPTGLSVSISDRVGWAVCVVDTETVGCDLELVEPRSPGFVHDFLTRAERDWVARSADPDAAANLVWSAKESALKVLRTGLRRDTRSVDVTIHSGQINGWAPLDVEGTEGVSFPGWWRRYGRFLFTVVGSAPEAPPVPLERPAPFPVRAHR
jgi:4'-phosphopantetheinyl transferase